MSTARDQLLAYYIIGSALLDGPPRPAPRPEPSQDFKTGWAVADAGGKLKTNPHEGGSDQWWEWNNGYKAAKKFRADQERRKSA